MSDAEKKQKELREKRRNQPKKKGRVLINTGEGKGKTTAALGLVMRALGQKKRVCVVQFLKHEAGHWGEVKIAKQLGLDWIKTGDGFSWVSKDLDETQAKALHGWEIAKEKISSGEFDLVVLDEFTYTMNVLRGYEDAWLDADEVVGWLQANKPAMMHLIITGRNAPQALIDYADTVTEMTKIKHAYDNGVMAMKGIEF